VIPVFNQKDLLKRALNSVIDQTYDKDLFEIIVVDDGSTENMEKDLWEYWTNKDRLKDDIPEFFFHRFPENRGKLAARNKGMEIAAREWICWLDNGDCFIPTYLETLAQAIRQHPEAEIFNFGALVFQAPPFYSSVRDTFMPELRPDGRGHDSFKSGRISSGQFIFKKKLIAEPEIGFLPETKIAYGTDDSFAALAAKRYPGINEMYGQNEKGEWLPFGNPFGDDYYMFWVLTRKHKSVPLMSHLYLQYLKA